MAPYREHTGILKPLTHDLLGLRCHRSRCILDDEGFEAFTGGAEGGGSDTIVKSEADAVHMADPVLLEDISKLRVLASVAERRVRLNHFDLPF